MTERAEPLSPGLEPSCANNRNGDRLLPVVMTDIVERVAEDDLVAFRGRVDQVLHSAVDKRRPDADFATAVDDARRPQGVLAKHAGLSAFIVDMHAPGVDMRPIRQIA